MTTSNRALALFLIVGLAACLIPWLVTTAAAVLTTASSSRAATANQLQIIGDGIARDIIAYVSEGIPLDEIVGLSDYLASDLVSQDLVAAALVQNSRGVVLGRYFAESHGQLALERGFDAGRWRDEGVEPSIFPIVHDGAVIGRVILGSPMSRAVADIGRAGLDFLVVLVITLIVGHQIVLTAVRQGLGAPMRALITLEGRIGRGRFDAVVPTGADDGPVSGALEAANKLVAAVNDRFVRVRAYLTEVAQYSFNPAAPDGARALARSLDGAGRFAPDGLSEAVLDHSDQFVGPVAFRAAAVLGAVLALVPALAPQVVVAEGALAASVAEALVAAAAVLALGLLLAVALDYRGLRPHAALTGAVATGVLLVLPELTLSLPLLLGGVALVAVATGLTARWVVSAHPAARAGAVVHAAAGFSAGAGIAAIGMDSAGPGAAVVTGVVAVLALVLLVLREATPGAARPAPARSALSVRHLAPLALAALPGWSFWAAGGLFMAVHAADVTTGAERPGLMLWGLAALAAAGGAAMLFALHRWRTRRIADVAVPLAVVALAAAAWTGAAGGGALVLALAALIAGAAAPAATAGLVLHVRGHLVLSTGAALSAGLVVGWAAAAGIGTASAALLLTVLAVAAVIGSVAAMLRPAAEPLAAGDGR